MTVQSVYQRGLQTFFASLAAATLSISSWAATPLFPADGAVVNTNIPELVWANDPKGGQQELWINGKKMEVLSPLANRYTPFPLSYGEHRWKIVQRSKGQPPESREFRFSVEDKPLAQLPQGALLLRDNWLVQSSETLQLDGKQLSTTAATGENWSKTSLPATVLTALVRNGVYPNPYFALNNMRIPDAHLAFSQKNKLEKYSHIPGKNPWQKPYWYHTQFRVPAEFANKTLWLTFNEISYRAEVWLNGQQLADSTHTVGMDRQFRFKVTPFVQQQGTNYLAVAIYPLDKPGLPAPEPIRPLADPGINMGDDADISLNYAKWDTVGWDWQPAVRDRDIGITEEVFLSATDDIELQDLHISTQWPSNSLDVAHLSVAFDLVNGAQAPREGKLIAKITAPDGRVTQWEQPFSAAADSRTSQVLSAKDQKALVLNNPMLWWPVDMGEPHLYQLSLTLAGKNGEHFAVQRHFGVRKLATRMHDKIDSRIFTINNRDVYVTMGNWVMDMMLTSTTSRLETEVVAAKEARLNMLRVWGPTGAPPSSFYDAADRHGVMIQQDFLHDYWGTRKNMEGFVPPIDVVEKASIDMIKKYRNHPSLVLWCGGNEGPNPREDLLKNKLLPTYDAGSGRYYLFASDKDGVQGGGPYHTLAPRQYFSNPKISRFNSEIGPSGLPEYESLVKFSSLPPKNAARDRYPVNGEWAYHDANDRQTDDRKFSHFDNQVRGSYGQLTRKGMAGLAEYSLKAQLVNEGSYRAPLEALNKDLWVNTTGFGLWKYNSSWPSTVWQILDWYLQPHAGFYATRRALEPLHIQYNYDDRSLSLVNRTATTAKALRYEATLYSPALETLWQNKGNLDLAAASSLRLPEAVPNPTGISYLKLTLLNAQGLALSHNFYWLNDQDQFQALADLPLVTVSAKATPVAGKPGHWQVLVRNESNALAISTRLRLVDAASQAELLPSWWSDNYLHLLPGETRRLDLRASNPITGPVAIAVSGYNLKAASLPIAP
jgi:hypothetical protein